MVSDCTHKNSDVKRWIEAVTHDSIQGSFASGLKDGQILCKLINCIRPRTITTINTSHMPFKEMENVSNFLRACRTLGLAEHGN